jgi:hypothetical protein
MRTPARTIGPQPWFGGTSLPRPRAAGFAIRSRSPSRGDPDPASRVDELGAQSRPPLTRAPRPADQGRHDEHAVARFAGDQPRRVRGRSRRRPTTPSSAVETFSGIATVSVGTSYAAFARERRRPSDSRPPVAGAGRARGESQVQTAAAPETCFRLDALLLQCLVGAASVHHALAPAGRPIGSLERRQSAIVRLPH